MTVNRVSPSALPDLRSTLRLAGLARPNNGVQGLARRRRQYPAREV